MYDSYRESAKIIEQESIPVGCIPPALYRAERDLSDKEPLHTDRPPSHRGTPVDRQTLLKRLSFPKLRLRAVKIVVSHLAFGQRERTLTHCDFFSSPLRSFDTCETRGQ